MTTRKAFALRIDPEVFSALEQWAADEFRSTNGQIEYLLSEAVRKAGRHPRKLRKKLPPASGGEP